MSIFKRLVDDRSGNFGIITAILLPVLCGAAGFAMDFTNAMQVKTNLQGMADAAALAAAAGMSQNNLTKAQAEELAEDYLVSQLLYAGLSGAQTAEQKAAFQQAVRDTTTIKATEPSGSTKSYKVELTTNYNLALNPITSVLAGRSVDIAINAVAASGSEGADARNGMSMYLVLDRSGSMSFATTTVKSKQTPCVNYTEDNWRYKDEPEKSRNYIAPTTPCYVRKIDALKTAGAALFSKLIEADKSITKTNQTSTLVRVGAVSYNDSKQSASDITWGTANASGYVQNLPSLPEGGTDANDAMQTAYKALRKSTTTEADAHNSKKNTSFDRYIVLMTDGQMTGNSSDWNYDLDQDMRAKCDKAKKDGIIIFSVAFMAPSKGQSLLASCATSSDYYYNPDNMAGLVTAFGEIAEKASKKTVRLTN